MTDDDIGSSQQPALSDGQLYRLAWVFYLILAIAGVLWIGVREQTIPLVLFFDVEAVLRDFGLGVAVAALLLLVWQLVDCFVPLARELEERLRLAIGPLDPSEAIGLALLSGFSEELFFRGAVQGSLGWPLAAALFAAVHTGGERSMWLWTAFAALSGVVFALLTVWTGNLLAAILGHTLFNLVNLYRLSKRPLEDPSQAS